MSIKNQLRLDYKLTPPIYTQEPQPQPDNNTTFDNLQTPGWTSMVRTEPNAELSNRTAYNHDKILDKLNKMDHIDLANSQFQKIRVKDTNLTPAKYDCSTLSRSRTMKENVSVHLRSFNQEPKHKRLEVTTLPSKSRIQLENSRQQSNKQFPKRGKTAVIVKNIPKQVDKTVGQSQREKRFNCITVHDYLYLDSKRQETKRMMEQVFEEQYKKQNTLVFRPSISKKSRELAENKYTRMQKLQEMESELIQQLQQLNKRQNSKAKLDPKVVNRQNKQKSQYEALNYLFQLLSSNNKSITKQTMRQAVSQLPLVCIRFLQKIIEKVYQGKQFTWLQFLSVVNDKKMVSNRQSLLVIAEKWMSRHKKMMPMQPHLGHSTYCQ